MENQSAQDPISRLKEKMEQNIQEVHRNKTKIKRLAESTIEELMKIHQLNLKAEALEKKRKTSNKKGPSETREAEAPGNSHKGFGLEYELANMKMIRKILNLAVSFEEKQCREKTEKKTHKRSSEKGKKYKSKKEETGRAPKILIVDDDRMTTKIIRHLLELHHHKVLCAPDAEEGLKMVFKEMPDLILLDIMLPGMDGLQLLAKIRASQKTSGIPVIILSSLSGEKDVLKGLEKGASDYILKPFSPTILFFKIKKILADHNEHIAYYPHP